MKVAPIAAVRVAMQVLRGSRVPGTPGLGTRFKAIPRLVRATVTGRYRGMGAGRLALLALGAVYVVSPVDLIPELLIPVLGLGDDLFVLTFVLSGLMAETEQFLAWELAQDAAAGRSVPGEVIGSPAPPRH
jgi:uncharacterized membrane protein YkvA (DUF1232 family)